VVVCKKRSTHIIGLLQLTLISLAVFPSEIRYNESGIFRDVTYVNIAPSEIHFVNGHARWYVPKTDEIVREVTISPYRSETSSGLPFVVDSSGQRVMLLLRNDEIVDLAMEVAGQPNVSGVGRFIFLGTRASAWSALNIYVPSANTVVSSYLREGDLHYGAANIAERLTVESPWVEGVPGHGIGEYIEFDLSSEAEPEVGTFNGIYVYNGFIDYDRPHLYRQNSRVRRFLVRDLTANEEWTVDLADTPNPQIIEMIGRERHRIQLVIDQVYPGTKYDDTCIAAILLRGYYPE
jgi:hypothetical protein